MNGQFIQTGEVALYVTVAGSGPPVLLLHGFPDSRLLWRHQMPALVEAGYRVIIPDLRGFGQSDAPVGVRHYRLAKIEADLMTLLTVLGCSGDIRLVGHDWGAIVGWHLLFHYPQRFRSYAALSVGHPAAFRGAGIRQYLRSWYTLVFQIPAIPEFFLRLFHFYLFRDFTHHHPENRQWIADLSRTCRLTAGINWYRANLFSLLSADFPRVSTPVMGLWSTQDFALTEKQMTTTEKWLDGPWRYERIENASHWIPLDQPDVVNRLLVEWVGR